MLSLRDRVRPRNDEVAAKVLDGEAIIINLANGNYYSLDKVGGLIWQMIEGQHSLEEMIAAISAGYDASREQAQADIEHLIEDLLRENLVVSSPDGASAAWKGEPGEGEKLPYESPKLTSYRDMADLLAMDPPTPGRPVTPWREPR
jgi:Coenzyme PQQ synthesis protein D (PqqD)